VDRDQRKKGALEMVQTRPAQRLQPKSPTQELQQQQTTGLNIYR
jgi:hypothetical protein